MSSFKSPCKVEDQNLQCNHALFYPSRRIYQSCLPLSLHEFNEKLFCSSFETGFTPFVTSFCTGFTPLVDYQICLFYGCWLWGLEEARYWLWFLNVPFAFNVTCYSSTTHTPFFYKQSIFDPCPENCLSFSKKSPPKIV